MKFACEVEKSLDTNEYKLSNEEKKRKTNFCRKGFLIGLVRILRILPQLWRDTGVMTLKIYQNK